MSGQAFQDPGTAATDADALPVFSAGNDFLDSFLADGPLLVALSGGSDSTALLHVFDHLIRKRGSSSLRLAAATVDHGLRDGSRREAEAAAALCAQRGIPHRILAWTGEKPGTGLQAAAREARYRLLAEEARRIGASAVLLGHTADDQAETIAMRSARGEGPGLSGMAPAVLLHETVWAFRPLLGQSRQVLRALLDAAGLGWIDDPSNTNRRFERVRLRMDGVSAALPPGTAGEGRLDHSRAEAEWLMRHVTILEALVARIDPAGLPKAADSSDAAGLFRLAAAIGGRVHPPGQAERERLVAWLSEGRPSRRTLVGTVFDRRREALYLYRESRGLGVERLVAGEIVDGRYRLAGPPGAGALVRPVARPEEMALRLVRSGLPEAIARRAAPACLEIADGTGETGLQLERIIAGGHRFLPGFDLPAMTALRDRFGLPSLPSLPVRQ